MGILPTAILIGCMSALRWILWAVSALLLVMVIVQAFRGDASAQWQQIVLIILVFFGFGFLSGRMAKFVLVSARRIP